MNIEAKQNLRAQKIICITGIALLLIKLIAWYLTHSMAVLTDALESITNVMSSFMGLYCLYLSALPKDQNHPYGHGKIELISAAVEGILIIIFGFLIIIESGIRLSKASKALTHLDSGAILLALTAAINYLIGHCVLKIGAKNRSLALIASGQHLQTDTYSTLAVILGLALLYLTGWTWMDSIIAIIFGLLILHTGSKILRKSVAGMMDETDQKLIKELVNYIESNRQTHWIDLHNLRIIQYGSALHVDCHLTVPWYLTVKEAHNEVKALEKLVKEKFGQRVELFVHVDACTCKSCELCTKEDCPVRKVAFRRKTPWTQYNTAQNNKHYLTEYPPQGLRTLRKRCMRERG
ncbi:MAG: cation diffusion facilitator family transporter [Flavobacteriales bacterium Tduv]